MSRSEWLALILDAMPYVEGYAEDICEARDQLRRLDAIEQEFYKLQETASGWESLSRSAAAELEAYKEACMKAEHRAEKAEGEAKLLRAVICHCLAALKNGSGASPECSIEFLTLAPEEVGAEVGKLRAELERLQKESEAVRRDADLAFDLLSDFIDLYENGPSVYEYCDAYGDAYGVHMGYSVKLPDEQFNSACDLINRVRPRAAIDAAQAERAKGGE